MTICEFKTRFGGYAGKSTLEAFPFSNTMYTSYVGNRKTGFFHEGEPRRGMSVDSD